MTAREQDTRAATKRKEATFVPSAVLPDVNPEPGYVFRWIRVASRGTSDAANMTGRLREGWTPVKAEDHPEIVQFSDPNSRFAGLIEQGGLLLCKISEEKVRARRRYYADRARSQIDAVDNNFMRENDRRMPLFRERKSEVKSTK